jgi:uncharacterized protein (TIGR04255 family)
MMPVSSIPLDSICYKKNFIKTIIFRIDFSPILKLKDNSPIDFQEAIKQYCSDLEIRDAFLHTMHFGKKKQSSERESYKQFVFRSKDKVHSVVLDFKFLSIEANKYDKYDDLKIIIEKVFNSFKKIYTPLSIKRLGLRYINEIKLNTGHPYEWKDYIHDSLINIYSSFYEKERYTRLLSQIYYSFDDHRLIFTYGTPNSEFPSKITRKEFLLDYDCAAENVEETDIIKDLDIFHNRIQTLFEYSIKPGLRKLMEK